MPESDLVLRAGHNKRTPKTHLTYSPWMRLKPKRNLKLTSSGTSHFSAPRAAHSIQLYLPMRFSMVERVSPPFLGALKKDKWNCKVRENVSRRDRLIGTIKVR